MRELPQFSPVSEAMMAALASRAHDWEYWEIREAYKVSSSLNKGSVPLLEDVQAVHLKIERKEDAKTILSEVVWPNAGRGFFELVDEVLNSENLLTRFELRDIDWSEDLHPNSGSSAGVKVYLKNSLGAFKALV